MALRIAITVLVGYLLGNLNGAVILSKLLEHDDVRSHGSGNAGFTNFYRNYGGLISLVVFAIDAAKAAAACILGKTLLAPYDLALEGAALAAVAVGLGHDFPALLGFHGGKGIVCGFASAIAMDWRVGVVTFAAFLLVYLLTHYVSLGSICGAVALFTSFALLHWERRWAVVGCGIMCLIAIWMHRENIHRLIHKTERKTDFFKKGTKQ